MLLTPREIRRIEARLAALPEPDLTDPDNPEWTPEDFARAKGPESLPPEVLAAFPRTVARLRGRGKKPRKLLQTLRLDPDIVAYFKAGGRLWQSRINAVLRKAMEHAE
ncbi:MAG: BrnA antitoxin family protein [Caulobacteraceae bacterium]|nr:BrnA antitoxin family protein [Caulobacteraceae bacterium]